MRITTTCWIGVPVDVVGLPFWAGEYQPSSQPLRITMTTIATITATTPSATRFAFAIAPHSDGEDFNQSPVAEGSANREEGASYPPGNFCRKEGRQNDTDQPRPQSRVPPRPNDDPARPRSPIEIPVSVGLSTDHPTARSASFLANAGELNTGRTRKGGAMSFDSSDERIVDYRNYDFRAVWVGRDHVDRFDRALLECALDHLDLRRTLEIGTGFGRLTPRILQGNGQYVGIDYDLGGVRDAHDAAVRAGPADSHRAWFAANVYHLPFASGSFSSICMVRVHHHLADPVRALREIARVLVPGGTALITYNDRTGFRSLIHDTGVALGLRGVAR